MHVHSFAPEIRPGSRVLVLGSMPGKASLRAGQYYAHPRNLFWTLMDTLLGIDRAAPYPNRVEALLECGVALWDVLHSCTRTSSLDSDIVPASIVPNDIGALLAAHPSIRALCFNGQKAEAVFRRHVLPGLEQADALELHGLPSTSPANAGIPLATKLERWRVLASNLERRRG